MPTTRDQAFNACARTDPEQLRRDLANLTKVAVNLPASEVAYWSLPRTRDAWRLPRDTASASDSDKLLMLPVRDEYYQRNAYLAIIPQPIVMHHRVAQMLEDYAWRLYRHYPIEDSLARREYGVPMLLGRFDVVVDKRGNIQICELDDVCSLWPALPKLNPIAETYLRALEAQIGCPIYTSELFQYSDGPQAASPMVRKEYARISYAHGPNGTPQLAYIPRTADFDLYVFTKHGIDRRASQKSTDRSTAYYESLLQRFYLHNEDQWRGDIVDAWLLDGEQRQLDQVALSVRAYRDMPGFKEHMDHYGPRSITMAWERDSKWPLVPEKLAALAANLDVAVAFSKQWEADHPSELLVFKTLHSARTEHTAIFCGHGTKLRGASSATQIARKFGDAAQGPIIIQPFKEPDSLAEAGIQFAGTEAENNHGSSATDRKLIRSVKHFGSDHPGERVLAGMEQHFSMIFRSFVVYLPEEKRLVHVGGMWQATDGRIVHGGSHSVAGPLYIDSLMGHSDAKRTTTLKHAEAMIENYNGTV